MTDKLTRIVYVVIATCYDGKMMTPPMVFATMDKAEKYCEKRNGTNNNKNQNNSIDCQYYELRIIK
ncbi:MAG: hypothetical protein OEM28_03440 [Nitrosopumilus sp.]|nr:hypothetical protein [Nitrosopumilus sp.]MDH3487406.1 hypothetical protein [Nitrosopumilus sp.]